MLKGLTGMLRVAVEMRRIANALEVIALHYAKLDGRMWNPRKGAIPTPGSVEQSELMHTEDAEMLIHQLRDGQEFMGTGYGQDE